MTRREIRRKAKHDRNATLDTAKKITDRLWMLEYKTSYGLDALLKEGLTSILSVARFLQKEVHFPHLIPNPLGTDGGCSTFNAWTPEGKVIMGRNFDFKESACTVLWTAPENGYKSFAVCNNNMLLYNKLKPGRRRLLRLMGAPYISMDGINEKGLAGAILEVITKPGIQNTGKTPVTTPVAFRAILDKCANVDEVVEFLKQYDMVDLLGACYHYQFTDASGKTLIIEYVNGKMHVYRQKHERESMNLANFFVTRGAKKTKRNGLWRFRIVKNALKENNVITENDAMDLLEKCKECYQSKYKVYYIKTNWSAVYNCTDRTILFCGSGDFSVKYKFRLDRPCEYEIVG